MVSAASTSAVHSAKIDCCVLSFVSWSGAGTVAVALSVPGVSSMHGLCGSMPEV